MNYTLRMNTRTSTQPYKEKISHGNAIFPFSLHHTFMPEGSDNILYLHWHGELELLVVLKGKALFYIEDQPFPLYEGQGMFIPPGCLHKGVALSNSCCEFYAFVFHPDFLIEPTNSYLFQKYLSPVFHLQNRSPILFEGELYSMLVLLYEKYNSTYMQEELALKGNFLLIWQYFFNHYIKSIIEESPIYLSQKELTPVMHFIHNNYHLELDLHTLADILHVSESGLCRIFKATIGMSPMTYLIRYRIMESCTLLTDTDKKIAYIATLTGFNNVSYYNRTFQKWLNCSPGQYRKRNNKMENQ